MIGDLGTEPRSLDGPVRALLAASDHALLRDPYPLYRALRERSPVHESGSVVVLARYADVKVAMRDTARFSSRVFLGDRAEEALPTMTSEQQQAYRVLADYDANSVSHSDGEQHARLRRIAHRAFTPRRIAALRASIELYTDALLEPLAADDVCDLRTLAYQLPLMVITDMLGVPPADRDLIHEWSAAIGRSRGVVDPRALMEAKHAVDAFQEYVGAIVVELRRAPRGTSLVEALLDAEQDERLTHDELTAMFILLLFAGHETTTNLIASGLLELLRHPRQWELLCANPAGVAPGAVEELLRFVSPVQVIQRIAITDVEYGEVRIRAGRHVIGLLGSANRDADAFERPDELDLARDAGAGHLDFGFGPHFCLGASLARLEGEVAFSRLAARFPRMRLATDADSLRWGGNTMLRSLEALPIRLGG